MLMISFMVLAWVPILGWIFIIVTFIFWIMGLISAVQGEEKEVPIIGALAQEWFKGL